jgi:hypothetical protein
MYAIVAIMILISLCLWHAIIATLIFYNDLTQVTRTSIFFIIDRYMLAAMLIVYALIHLFMLIWLIFVPYKRRREMEYLDRQYAEHKHIQLDSGQPHWESAQDVRIGPSPFSVDSVPRISRATDNVPIIADASNFFPQVTEEGRSSRTVMTMAELRQQDDQFYRQSFETQSSVSLT